MAFAVAAVDSTEEPDFAVAGTPIHVRRWAVAFTVDREDSGVLGSTRLDLQHRDFRAASPDRAQELEIRSSGSRDSDADLDLVTEISTSMTVLDSADSVSGASAVASVGVGDGVGVPGHGGAPGGLAPGGAGP